MRRSRSEGGIAGAGKVYALNGGETDVRGLGGGYAGGEINDGLAEELGVVGEAVEVDSELEIVAAVPLVRGQIEISDGLRALGFGLFVEVIVSEGGVGSDLVGGVSIGDEMGVVLVEGESEFEEFASGEVMLLFHAGNVGRGDVFGIGELRAEGREESVLIVNVVDQETGGEDVAAGEVGLNFAEIAEAEDVVVVLVDGKFGVDDVVVFAFEGVVEPDFSFIDGAGESEAGKELVETPAVLVLERREEVGGEEAEVIVTDPGVESEDAAGAFAEFGGLAGGFNLNGAEGVGADANQELTVGGLGDIEAVEYGDSLIGLGAGDVGLTVLILDDARDEVEGVAVVVGGGKNHVDDVESAERFLGGNLRGIDGGRGLLDVYDFADFLLVRECDFDVRTLGKLKLGLDGGIESFFFDANLVFAGGKNGEGAASGIVGFAVPGRLR